jgi:hypothetical protein
MTFIMNRAVVTGSYAPSLALEKKLDGYDRDRRALLDELDAVDPILLSFGHLAGEWSILEILEHLVLAERAVLLHLPEPSGMKAAERTSGQRFRYALLMLLLTCRIRVRVPSVDMVPRGNRKLSELRRLWDENARWLRSYVARGDGLDRAVFHHPVAGPMTVSQAVRAGQLHLAVHRRQIWRILECPPLWEP